MKIILSFINRAACNHDYGRHSWTYVKCIKCGKTKQDEKKAIFENEKYIARRREHMRNMGFSEERIKEDEKPLTETIEIQKNQV